MRSKIQWFTEVCKSHCIAHFAASFIVVRTNAFVAGSHQIESIQVENSLLGRVPCRPKATVTSQWSEFGYRVNDPSAGSPTETLLRLLLPLSNKVYSTSQFTHELPRRNPIRSIHRIAQSVGATGGVYKGQGRNRDQLMIGHY